MGDVSEEHGEQFHRDIKEMEQRYVGHWKANMMGDYLWPLDRMETISLNESVVQRLKFDLLLMFAKLDKIKVQYKIVLLKNLR